MKGRGLGGQDMEDCVQIRAGNPSSSHLNHHGTTRHTPDPGIPPVLDLLRWLVRVKGTLHPESDAVVRGTGIWRMYLLGLEGWLRTSDPPDPFAAATPTADCRPQTAVQCGPGVLDVVSSRLRPNVSCRQRRRQPANPPLGAISQCSRRPLLFLLRLLF